MAKDLPVFTFFFALILYTVLYLLYLFIIIVYHIAITVELWLFEPVKGQNISNNR